MKLVLAAVGLAGARAEGPGEENNLFTLLNIQ
jgi:hypothetical protein